MSTLEKQQLFSECIAKLITEMYARGFKVTCGDFWAKPRSPLEHKKDSQHYVRMAGDLNLFKDGVWLDKTEDHAQFGAFWESLHPSCRWGGHYRDGNHYEVIG